MAEIKKSQKSAPAGRKYIEVPVKSALPIWSAAAVWVLAALFVPMYNVMHILGVALVSLGVALLVKKLLPKETKTVEVPFASGNLELDSMVGEINKAVDSLEASRKLILAHDPETADVISSISATAGKIRDAIAQDPKDLISLRRFFNYYLPTTLKLTEKYSFVLGQGVESANATETKESIKPALKQINNAFEKQLDALYADDALDISTDVTVLEAMLKRDNLN